MNTYHLRVLAQRICADAAIGNGTIAKAIDDAADEIDLVRGERDEARDALKAARSNTPSEKKFQISAEDFLDHLISKANAQEQINGGNWGVIAGWLEAHRVVVKPQ